MGVPPSTNEGRPRPASKSGIHRLITALEEWASSGGFPTARVLMK